MAMRPYGILKAKLNSLLVYQINLGAGFVLFRFKR